MLQSFGPDIWLFDGPPITAALGFHYPTRMAVIRLSDGGLLIWSPTALSADLLTHIRPLGTVTALIAPNALHHVHLSEWIDACPEAKVIAAPGLAKKRADISFDHTVTAATRSLWPGEIEHVVLDTRITSEIVLFHRQSGTVIFTDVLQQMPNGWYSGWRALVARLDLMTAPEPSVPRKFRIAVSNRAAARDVVLQILDWPLEQVVMAHGTPVTRDAKGFLRRAFSWLL